MPIPVTCELGHTLSEGVSHLLALAHVGLHGDALAALLLDEALGLHEVVPAGHRIEVRLDVLADVDGDDLRPLAGLLDRVGSPLTATRTRYERDFAVKSSCHSSSSVPSVVLVRLQRRLY